MPSTRHLRVPFRLLTFSMIAALLAGCAALPAPAAPGPAARGPLTLTIVHTNDTLGYLFPCG